EPDENQPMPTAEDIVGNPDNLVGSIPSTSTTFTDIVSTSKGNNFLYSATSFYGTGTTSRGSEPAGTQLPVIKNPDFRKGTIFIEASGSFIKTGALLIIDGKEAFPLRNDETG